jgi:hypothetical protein
MRILKILLSKKVRKSTKKKNIREEYYLYLINNCKTYVMDDSNWDQIDDIVFRNQWLNVLPKINVSIIAQNPFKCLTNIEDAPENQEKLISPFLLLFSVR